MWRTFGFKEIKKILDKQLRAQVFPHAYLFAGAAGIGKKTLALEFSEKILNTQTLNNHPDFRMLEPEGEVGVEQIRNLIAGLNFKPLLGAHKVCIINNTESLSQQALNALLKTLEEPSSSTIIILIAKSRRPLPTLESRCQVLFFNRLTHNELRNFAKEQRLKVAEETFILSFGSVGRMRQFLADTEDLESSRQQIKQFRELKSSPLADRLLAIPILAELEESDLRQVLLVWLEQARDELRTSGQELLRIFGGIYSALQDLATNKNRKLILQELFLKF